MSKNLQKEKMLAAKEAVKYIENNQIIGLGTGSTAEFATMEIGAMVKNGLKIKAVPTSNATAELAKSLNIPLLSIDEIRAIDLTIDGADEFDENLNLLKGGGGALFREKMVARLTEKEIIIADSSKKVETLGAFKIPVEVVPMAVKFVQTQIEELGARAKIREKNGEVFITDAGNKILDADFGLIENVRDVSFKINDIEGVICHGLFIDLAQIIIMPDGENIQIFEK